MSMRGAEAAARDERARHEPRWAARLLSTDRKTFAGAQQLLFSAVVCVPVLTLVSTTENAVGSWQLILGLLILLTTTLVVLATPRSRFTGAHDLVLPVADIIALGLCRFATMPDGAPLSTLAIFPALWLISRLRIWGLGLALVAVALAVTLPSIVTAAQSNAASWIGYLALPIGLMMIGVMQILLLDRSRALAASAARDERLLAGVLDILPVGVLVMDSEGHDLRSNQVQQRLHRIASPPDSADPTEAGHLVFSLEGRSVPVEDRPARRVIRGEVFDDMVGVVGEPAGESRILSVSSRIIYGEGGEVESRILIFTDVTEERRANQAREDVIATVSHELRTPLTSILGYTDLCLEALEDMPDDYADQLRPGLEIVERNAESLYSRVEDLLLQQQAHSGRLTLHLQDLDLCGLVRQGVESARSAAVAKSIRLEFISAPTAPAALDRKRIEQVLDNIVSNAVKYTPAGGGVRVAVFSAADALGFSVQDTGPGMSAHEQSQVFTPFFRGHAGSTGTSSGAGLGLPLAHSIVAAHGGGIAIDSALGEGTTFTVSFPRPHHDQPTAEEDRAA